MNIRVDKGRQQAKQSETKSSYDRLQGIEMDHQTANQQDAGRTVTSEVTGISHNRNVQIAENRKKAHTIHGVNNRRRSKTTRAVVEIMEQREKDIQRM